MPPYLIMEGLRSNQWFDIFSEDIGEIEVVGDFAVADLIG
jgi:hypothetical protein